MKDSFIKIKDEIALGPLLAVLLFIYLVSIGIVPWQLFIVAMLWNFDAVTIRWRKLLKLPLVK
ncbi:MAG: hypothetical protein KGZ80_00255 [Methylomonas sp.]|nr:hypothetical protein [Methylomonas sp.]